MRHVHAFGDDALGDLDAVGLIEAIRDRSGQAGPRSSRRRSPAPSRQPGPERLGVRGVRPRPRPGVRAPPRAGLLRRRADVHQGQRRRRGTADDARHRRLAAAAGRSRRRLRPDVPGHRADAAGQDPDVGVRLQRLGRAPAARTGAQPVEHRPHRRRVVVGFRRLRRRRRGADRARQRRRRLDPHPGVLQRTRRAQAVAWPATAGQGSRARCRSASSPTGWSPDRCATPRRSTARPNGSGATPSSRRSATCSTPGKQRLRIAVITHSLLRESSPEVRELTLKSAALLEELGHRVDHLEKPPVPSSFVSDFVLYWGLLAMGQIQQNKRAFDGFDVHPVGQPVTGPGPARAPQSASHAAGAAASVPRAAAHRTSGPHLRRSC